MSFERGDIAIRWVEERGRAGYSRTALARELEISVETLRLNEIGQSGLNAEVLAKSATLGIDVQYVLTGIRSANLAGAEHAIPQPPQQTAKGGSGNVLHFNNGGTVNMVNTSKHVNKTVAKVEPGGAHISEGQAAKLTALVQEVVELEAKLKKAPKSYRAVWGALNAHCEVTRYLLIAASDFDKAEKYLRQWIGRLNSMASAPVADNETWRKRRYAYIKINTKDSEAWLLAYLRKNFKADSLSVISDDDLDKTYRAVASRKRKASP